MNKQEQSYGQFEQLKEQLLMYTFSGSLEDRNSPRIKNKKPSKVLNSQRQQLHLKQPTQFDRDIQGFLRNNKTKNLKQSYGRILILGDAIFKSNFECGNICTVDQTDSSTYTITLQKQTNSDRMSIWFYYSCFGLKGQNTFIINGFTKTSSLYNDGMKICVKDKDGKWRRGGTKISYYRSDEDDSYSLKFNYFFANKMETEIQFAYCFPYSYTKLLNFIKDNSNQLQVQTLTNTLEGRVLPVITIGNTKSQYVLFLSARVHPGQTVSSFIMEGFIKELLNSSSQLSKMLRQNFLFKILPMINADGVAKGNYRFSASGHDLNRKWLACRSNKHPQIYYWKNFIKKFSQIKKPLLFIDMHGHSRKKNVFFYGCSKKQNGISNTKPKMLPYLMEQIFGAYKFDYCSFAIQKDKQGTARITMWKQLKIDYIYTLQSTFCNGGNGPNYLQADYQKIGSKLCQGVAIYFQDLCKVKNIKEETLQKMLKIKNQISKEFQTNAQLREAGMNDDSGSDSQPEKGQNIQPKEHLLEPLQIKPQAKFIKRSIRTTKITKKNQAQQRHQTLQHRSNEKTPIIGINMQKQGESNVKFSKSIERTIRTVNTSQTERNRNFNFLSTALEAKKIVKQRKFSTPLNYFQVQSRQSIVQNIKKQKQQSNENNLRLDRIDQAQILRRKLLLDKGGAQYRRVRKLAQQTNRKKNITVVNTIQKPNSVVRGLQGNNLFQWSPDDANNKISPSFFPQSRKKSRAISTDMCMKKNFKVYDLQGRNISINGQQFKVKCLGKKLVNKY